MWLGMASVFRGALSWVRSRRGALAELGGSVLKRLLPTGVAFLPAERELQPKTRGVSVGLWGDMGP